jgi:excisionase family DNA binding protein
MALKYAGNSRKLSATDTVFDNKIGGENKAPDSPQEPDSFFSPKSAARYLDVSIKFIYERIQSGEIESYSFGGRIKRIRKTALEKWLNAQSKRKGS